MNYKMDWEKVENIIGETVPECLKIILTCSGYNTRLSLSEISVENVYRIEKAINDSSGVIQTMSCCYADVYKNRDVFELLPGHISFLCALSAKMKTVVDQKTESTIDFPFILRQLVLTYETNKERNKFHAIYNDSIKYFSTYIFLLGGRACYEFLRSNLPIPSTSRICEFDR